MKMIDAIQGQNIVEIEYYNDILFNLISDIGVYYGIDLNIDDFPYGVQLTRSAEFTLEDGILTYQTQDGDDQPVPHSFNLNELDALP